MKTVAYTVNDTIHNENLLTDKEIVAFFDSCFNIKLTYQLSYGGYLGRTNFDMFPLLILEFGLA